MGGGSACDSPALCFAAGLWYNRKKRRKGRCAVYEMAQMQLTVYDFVQPFGGALDEDNRVSLYVCVDGNEVIVNKHGGEDEIK